MLSYQHAYHAGGPADIVKHALLAMLLERLTAKDTPLTYYDTHSGRGYYPLDAPETQKIMEYRHGWAKVWPEKNNAPPALASFLNAQLTENTGANPVCYLGSPCVAAHVLRTHDDMHLCEAHPQEIGYLRDALGRDKRVHIHAADGHVHVPALMPPLSKRALVLIDPSYEIKTEYTRTVDTVAAILKRLPKAVVMVWYPVLRDGRHTPLVDGLTALAIQATWQGELNWTTPDAAIGAYGTGQIILNMPYQLDHDAHLLLEWLTPVLEHHRGQGRLTAGFIHPPA